MPLLGAHMSIAGGLHKAVEAAAALGMETVQIFTHNPSQWAVKPIGSAGEGSLRAGKLLTKNNKPRSEPVARTDEVLALEQAKLRFNIPHVIAHSSYLINLASPDEALWKKSLDAYVVELQRAQLLGIPSVVLHPGAYTSSSEEAGWRRVIEALNEIHGQTRGIAAQCLLENTAGQGSCLGWRFEHLATILDGVKDPERLGICFDTCHAFAAGYPMASHDDYQQTMAELTALVGLERIRAIHLNDSKRELGSRVDRHEHIGKGQLGSRPFARLLNDGRFRCIPMYLETPKGEDPKSKRPWDTINLRRLRRLAGKPPA